LYELKYCHGVSRHGSRNYNGCMYRRSRFGSDNSEDIGPGASGDLRRMSVLYGRVVFGDIITRYTLVRTYYNYFIIVRWQFWYFGFGKRNQKKKKKTKNGGAKTYAPGPKPPLARWWCGGGEYLHTRRIFYYYINIIICI